MIIKRVSTRRKKLNALFFEPEVKFDGEYSDDGGLFIDRSAFEQWGRAEGDEVDGADVENLICRSRFNRACSKALWLLDARDYTARGMELKLRRDFGPQAASAAVERMVDLGLIDDERYAERYAEQLLTVRNVSAREALMKLISKGVPRDVAQAAIDALEVSGSDQLDRLIESKYAHKLAGADSAAIAKVIAALARKGFAYSDIRDAVSRFCDADLYE